MGTMIQLTAADGHKFSAYRVEPKGKPKGAIIVVMEIFGVNSHIKKVTDEYAADGYLAIAPAMFDRVHPGLDVGYGPEDLEIGRAAMKKVSLDDAMKDIAATMKNVESAGKIGIVGYCWGGTATFKAACSLGGLACASAYYGGSIPGLIAEKPKCPVMFHWGETDHSIPLEKAKEVAAAHKTQTHHFYAAGHGFNCDQRGSYSAEASKVARERSLEMFRKYVG
ncbi:MAG: dienelactone hydrolase family protein [Betaproteobacteria bacterium]|nr:dienelactone hydrolase family protein [Betaproteobacteria bacterium]